MLSLQRDLSFLCLRRLFPHLAASAPAFLFLLNLGTSSDAIKDGKTSVLIHTHAPRDRDYPFRMAEEAEREIRTRARRIDLNLYT